MKGPDLIIDEDNPWPGLDSFNEAAQRFFNGREQESAELRRLIRQAPLTVLFGKSGLGKTSLLQAGLFPLLRREHVLPVYLRLNVTDRSLPMIDQVREVFRSDLQAHHVDAPDFAAGESLWHYLHRPGLELWSDQNQLLTPLFVLDQFEEVFTLGAENAEAIGQLRVDLADLVENRLPAAVARSGESESAGNELALRNQGYKVLLSFREDFLPVIEGWKRELPSIMRSRLRLLPMSGRQAFQAVHNTAPHLVDEALAHEIVAFVAAAQAEGTAGRDVAGEVGALEVEPALLSLVCHGLNERRKALNMPAFDRALLAGTGKEIVSTFYRQAVGDLPERTRDLIRYELITAAGFRKTYDVDDARSVHGVTDQQLRLLVDRRLLRIEPYHGTERVELTHDLLCGVVYEDRESDRERKRQQHFRRRMAMLAGAFLAALVLVFVLTGLIVDVRKEQRRAQLQSLKVAKANVETAHANADAIVARADAITERARASKAEVAAQNAFQIAERSRSKADKALAEAEADRAAAEVEKAKAKESAREAQKSKAEAAASAVKARDETVVALAGDLLGEDPTLAALVLLEVQHPQETPFAVAMIHEAMYQGISSLIFPHPESVSQVSFSPDGSRILTVSGGQIRLWPANGEGQPVAFERQADVIRDAAFSHNGKLVAVAYGNGIILVRKADGTGTAEKLLGLRVSTAAFSPDDSRLVTASYGRIMIWKLGGGSAVVIKEYNGVAGDAVFTADGRRIVTVEGESVRVRNLDEGAEQAPVTLDHLESAAVSADGNLVAGLRDGGDKIMVMRSDGSVVAAITAHQVDNVSRLFFSPDAKKLVLQLRNRTLAVYGTDGKGRPVILGLRKPGTLAMMPIAYVACSPDSKELILGGIDGTVVLRHVDGKGSSIALKGHKGEITSAAFSPDGSRVVTAADEDHAARVWNWEEAGEALILKGHEEAVNMATFSHDGSKAITASSDGTVRIWNASHPDRARVINVGAPVTSAAMSPDGTLIVTTSKENVARLWRTDGTRQSVPLIGHSARVNAATFSPDGSRIVTASDDKTARVWSTADVARKPVVLDGPAGHYKAVKYASFSPDGGRVVTASYDGTARVWRADGAGEPVTIKINNGVDNLTSASFNNDGTRIVTSSTDGTAQIWKADGTGHPVILKAKQWVNSAAFSQDGTKVLTASTGAVRLWDSEGKQDPVVLKSRGGSVTWAAFSPDGTRIVMACSDGTARIWDISHNPQDMIRRETKACLTAELRQKFLGESPAEARAKFAACERAHGR